MERVSPGQKLCHVQLVIVDQDEVVEHAVVGGDEVVLDGEGVGELDGRNASRQPLRSRCFRRGRCLRVYGTGDRQVKLI